MPFYSKQDLRQNKRLKTLDKRIKKVESEIETKYIANPSRDGAGDPGPITLTVAPVGVIMNGPQQGVTVSTRIGSAIKCTSFQLRGVIQWDSTAAVNRVCRILLVYWTGNQSGIPALVGDTNSGTTAVLDSDQVGTVPSVYYPYSKEYGNRAGYKVLIDKTYTQATQDALTDPVTVLNLRCKLSRVTRFDSIAAGITDFASNSLILYYFCDNNIAPPRLNYAARVYFKDA